MKNLKIAPVYGPTVHTEHHTDILHVITTEIPESEIVNIRLWIDGIHVELASGYLVSCQWRDRTWSQSYARPDAGHYEIAALDGTGCVQLPGRYDSVIPYVGLSEIAGMCRTVRAMGAPQDPYQADRYE